jgi:4,5-dihydroxyphthalate decarboxylase
LGKDVSLTFAVGSTARFQPILDREIRPEGIDLDAKGLPVGDIFWSMPLTEPYDVSEMSLTGYLWAIQHGRRWIALPIFPGWVYSCHADTLVNVNAGIERTADLRGKRVGVPEYPVAAVSWIRDAWEQEAGLGRDAFTWFQERTDKSSHYRPLGYQAPARMEQIPEGKTVCEMLISGEIDAATRYFGSPAALDRNPVSDRSLMTLTELADHPNVRWLYPDRKAAALAYHELVGYPQAIHCIIVKEEVVDRYPWVPRSLYDAFAESTRRTAASSKIQTSFDFPLPEQQQVIGPDFSPAGLDAGKRRMLERFLELADKDGFLVGGRRFSVDEMFHESTLDA